MGAHRHPVLQEQVTGKGDHSLVFHKLRSEERQNKAEPRGRKSVRKRAHTGVSESRRRMVVLLAEMASSRKVVEA